MATNQPTDASHPRPPWHRETDESTETETKPTDACPHGRGWCDPAATIETDDAGWPCLSCWLRRPERTTDPHPKVVAMADARAADETGGDPCP